MFEPLLPRELVFAGAVRPPLTAPALAVALLFAAPLGAGRDFAGMAFVDFADFEDDFDLAPSFVARPNPNRCFQELVPSGAVTP